MIDEEPIFLYATVRENSQSMFYMNRSVRSSADEEEYVKEEELCMSWA